MVDDSFGVRQIYPSKVGGESWFISTDPESDGRIIYMGDGGELSYNEDGDYYKMSQNQEVRIGILTTDGYSQGSISTEHAIIKDRGYMSTPKDWRNFEVTIYAKYTEPINENLTIYTRTGKHSKSRSCEGFAYKGVFNYPTGMTQFAKEQWHVNEKRTEFRNELNIGSTAGKYIGIKFCVFNINNNANVRGEIWIDKDETNSWRLADYFVDAGSWGDHGEKCKGSSYVGTDSFSDYIGTHGGPIIWFKWDTDDDVLKFRKASIREIDISLAGDNNPDPDPPDPPTPPPPPPPPQTTTGTAYATLRGVYNINFDESDGCSGLAVDVPPLEPIYNVTRTYDVLLNNDRDRVGLVAHDNSITSGNTLDKSAFIGRKIRRIDLYLRKVGAVTGTANVMIRRGSSDDIQYTFDSIDVTTLKQVETLVQFEALGNTYKLQKDDKITFEYAGGTAAAHIAIGANRSDPFDGRRTCLIRREPSPSAYYVEDVMSDLAGVIYI